MDENNNNTLEEQKKDPAPEEGGSVGEKPAEKTVNESEKSNLGLILGITVPIAAVIISGTVIFFT